MRRGRTFSRRAFLRLFALSSSAIALSACDLLPARPTEPAPGVAAKPAATAAPSPSPNLPSTALGPKASAAPVSSATKPASQPLGKRPRGSAWTGKLLDVDLSSGRVEVRDSSHLHQRYLGGRGVAGRLAWDEIPKGTGPFDPENRLMIMAGALTGTTAPYSGRGGVYAISPQAYPKPWFSRAGLGGHFAPALKCAGYDGIIVHGQAADPVYLYIEDEKVEIRSAEGLWGQGLFATQKRLMDELGRETRIVAIGPAGERLSRIAVIATETQSAAGQGGFGAVMGSKKLKAIAVRGRGSVRTAAPEEFFRRCQAVTKECRQARVFDARLDPREVSQYACRLDACTQRCAQSCGATYYRHVPSVLQPGQSNSGQLHCVAYTFQGFSGSFYGWRIGFAGGFELANLASDYGLNHWDLLYGIMPWLRACQQEGSLARLDDTPIDLDDIRFWAETLRKIAYREGVGDVLAEGGRRAAEMLGAGQDTVGKLYPAWGQAGHWDGHGDHGNFVFFPFWLVPALQWALDSRDPIASGHGYASALMRACPLNRRDKSLSWEAMGEIGRKVYGTPEPLDPRSGYGPDKAIAAAWHIGRSVLKDSLGLDDYMFPRLFSLSTPDGLARAGEVIGPSFEYWLYQAATGTQLSEEEMHLAAERAHNLERALLVRDAGRSRTDDESVIPYFSEPENFVNPYLGAPQRLDADRFRALLDEFYRRKGWDSKTGVPTAARLNELGLEDVTKALAG